MKKKLLLVLSLVAVLCCLLALSVCAEDNAPAVTHTFYVVQSQDSQAAIDLKAQDKEVIVLSEAYADTRATSGQDWIDSFAEGAHIELIFAENIIESVGEYKGILLNKPITVTVRYNGFVHLITNAKMDRENLFVLRHSGASINLIGSSEIYDKNGEVIKDFTYNSSDLSKNVVQIRHPKVYCWVHDGNAYVEYIRSTTGQELVYVDNDDSNADPDIRNTYEFVNCALYSATDPIGLLGQNAAHKNLKIDGGYYSSVNVHTIYSGSYIKNCELGSFSMDCWSIMSQMLVFENATITGKITTATGRTHLSFYDCSIDTAKFSLGGDGAGSSYALVYTSATCENDGTLNVYKQGKGTTPVNDDSKYAQTVVDFYADPQNKAYGHSYGWEYFFSGAKYLSACTAQNTCSSCNKVTESINIDAMLVFLGYSVPEFGQSYSITLGIQINSKAISDYESLKGSVLNYGFAVALKDKLGESCAPLGANGEAVPLESGNVIKADITSEKNAYADLVVAIPDAHVDTLLLMCAYVTEQNGDSLEISYVQNGNALVENNLFDYISYNNH